MSSSVASLRSQLTATQHQVVGAVTHVVTDKPLVALTFDDGPHPEFTPRLLDVLSTYKARATFFMVGRSAERNPELVLQASSKGHVIGNHSWDHRPMTSLEQWRRKQDINAAQESLGAPGLRLFRPPYGIQSFAANLDARKLKFRLVAWTLDVADWADPDAARMSARLIEGIRPGAIVLLHDALYDAAGRADLQPDRSSMLDALSRTLDRLIESYQFVTVPELMSAGRPVSRLWPS